MADTPIEEQKKPESAPDQDAELEHDDIDHVDAGESLYEWETWEFPPHERSKNWYIGASIIAALCIIYAIATANYIFAIIILLFGILFLLDQMRHPERIKVHITNLGVVFGDEFYSYEEMKDFSIVYSPPDVKLLYIDFIQAWHPLLTVHLEDADPNEVRDLLVQYAFENLEREDETLTDMVKRLYKL